MDPLDRRWFLQIIADAVVARVTPGFAEPADKWVDPPGAETTEVAARIDAAVAALERGSSPSSVLCDARYAAVHAYPRFRAAIAAHATAAPLAIAGKDEPGERMVLTLEAAPEALVYLYQTSAKGWYSDRGHHIRATAGDHQHARLFGYVRTNKRGIAVVHTIRPGGYPGGELPAHVHVLVGTRAVEIVFADDPRLSAEARERAGHVIAKPVKDGATWRIRAAID